MFIKRFSHMAVLLTLVTTPSVVYASDFQKVIKHATYIGTAEIIDYREHHIDAKLLEGPRAGQVEIKFSGAKHFASGRAIDRSLTKKITPGGEPGDDVRFLSHWPVKGSRPFVLLGKNNQFFYFGREVEDQKVQFWAPIHRHYKRYRKFGGYPKNCPDSEEIAVDKKRRCLVSLSRFADYRADIKKRLANEEKKD